MILYPYPSISFPHYLPVYSSRCLELLEVWTLISRMERARGYFIQHDLKCHPIYLYLERSALLAPYRTRHSLRPYVSCLTSQPTQMSLLHIINMSLIVLAILETISLIWIREILQAVVMGPQLAHTTKHNFRTHALAQKSIFHAFWRTCMHAMCAC